MRDFTGFRFGQTHSEDLGLTVISSSSKYIKETQPGIKDHQTEVPGGNGSYLFGQTFSNLEIKVNIAFENVTDRTWRKISNLFSIDKPQDLVFDENPYKTYKAKLKSKPNFKFVCFDNEETGERIYNGDGDLTFICYYPFAFGFNKYIVTAADYYNSFTPEQILNEVGEVDKYKTYAPMVKSHYNVEKNMREPWKGGYPSIQQVQSGELYYNNPETQTKEIIDVRKYFDNIPEWQSAAKLLISPTLDYDSNLIYMPQYSKTNYYNMNMGLNRENGIIGSRILVYNPGDLPINFELELGNLVSKYRANMRDDELYTFRISRYNVQRLKIEQAVDWCGMKTFSIDDNEDYKYGNRYVTLLTNQVSNEGKDWQCGDDWNFEVKNILLGKDHPEFVYYTEPIPREELGYFIRLFYWESEHIDDPNGYSANVMNWEEGNEMAQRYEDLYKMCATEEEQYELYWKTLKELFSCYNEINFNIIHSGQNMDDNIVYPYFNENAVANNSYTFEDFFYDYINNPPEFYRQLDDLNYGEFLFNIATYPQYYTFDYLDITSENFAEIKGCDCGCDILYNPQEVNSPTIKPLFIDFSKRMLYNENSPEWSKLDNREIHSDGKGNWMPNSDKVWFEENEDKRKNFFKFKPYRKIFNDNVKAGKWFKIPPGWSMIEITPVVEEGKWGGKRWLDARPFIWGTSDPAFRYHFDQVYRQAAIDYLSEYCPDNVMYKTWTQDDADNNTQTQIHADPDLQETTEQKKEFFSQLSIDQLESYLQFNRWYVDDEPVEEEENDPAIYYKDFDKDRDVDLLTFGYQLTRKRIEKAEFGFLKKLNDYWHIAVLDENGNPIGSVDDWWWYANSYTWANFPPTYWAYADLLNKAQIKYTPLFY